MNRNGDAFDSLANSAVGQQIADQYGNQIENGNWNNVINEDTFENLSNSLEAPGQCINDLTDQIMGDRCSGCNDCPLTPLNDLIECLANNIAAEANLCEENDEICKALIDNQNFLVSEF